MKGLLYPRNEFGVPPKVPNAGLKKVHSYKKMISGERFNYYYKKWKKRAETFFQQLHENTGIFYEIYGTDVYVVAYDDDNMDPFDFLFRDGHIYI